MKVLFLGLGGVGQRHLRNLVQLRPDASLAAVRHTGRSFEIGPDLRADYSVDIMRKYDIPLFPDIATAIAGFRPDCAVISSPSSVHAVQALTLIERDVPILLEKPVCVTESELETLLKATKKHRAIVMVAYMLRFNPSVRKLADQIRGQTLGRPYSIHLEANSFMPSWHPYEMYNEFYAGRRDLGGGAILTEIHLCDLLDWIFGLPERVWTVGGKLSDYDFDVEDSATALMEYRLDGVPMAVTLNMSFVQRPVRFAICLKAEHGRITWSLLDNRVEVKNLNTACTEVFVAEDFERNTMFVEEMRHFLTCIENGETPQTALEKVAGGQRIALAMKRSLELGTPVALS